MTQFVNELDQPIGEPLPHWVEEPAHPSSEPMDGRFCRLESLSPDRHAEELYAAIALARISHEKAA